MRSIWCLQGRIKFWLWEFGYTLCSAVNLSVQTVPEVGVADLRLVRAGLRIAAGNTGDLITLAALSHFTTAYQDLMGRSLTTPDWQSRSQRQ